MGSNIVLVIGTAWQLKAASVIYCDYYKPLCCILLGGVTSDGARCSQRGLQPPVEDSVCSSSLFVVASCSTPTRAGRQVAEDVVCELT